MFFTSPYFNQRLTTAFAACPPAGMLYYHAQQSLPRCLANASEGWSGLWSMAQGLLYLPYNQSCCPHPCSNCSLPDFSGGSAQFSIRCMQRISCGGWGRAMNSDASSPPFPYPGHFHEKVEPVSLSLESGLLFLTDIMQQEGHVHYLLWPLRPLQPPTEAALLACWRVTDHMT